MAKIISIIPIKKKIGGNKKVLKEINLINGMPDFEVISSKGSTLLVRFKNEEDYSAYVNLIYMSNLYVTKLDYDRVRRLYGEHNTFDKYVKL